MAGLIYLASPYSNPSEAVRLTRYFQALAFTTQKLKEGYAIFSPIVYGEQMAKHIGTDFESWATLNDRVLTACDAFWVLTLPGWRQSRGVRHEINLWKDFQPFRAIRFFNADGQESFDESHRNY